jgi:hypothetical protein
VTLRTSRAAHLAAALIAFGATAAMPAAATFTNSVQPAGTLALGSVNPQPVTKLHVKACAVGVLGSSSLNWTASTSPGLSGYDVFRDATQLTSPMLTPAATSYNDPLLITLGGTYTYTVRAYAGAAAVWHADKSVTVELPLVGCNNVTTP